MNSKEIDILNIILIVISLVLAFNLPFELFLFSYAFLGPLHYLTEINWLKEKNYFLKETKWAWVFVFFAFWISLPVFIKLKPFSDFYNIPYIKSATDFMVHSSDEIIMIAILFAIGMIYFKKKLQLLLFLVPSCILVVLALHYFPGFAFASIVFIPTIIHVYFFTLLFMIYGSLNSKSTPGVISIVLLAIVPFIIMASKINPVEYTSIGESTMSSYNSSHFGSLNTGISKLFISNQDGPFNHLSVIGIKIQIFVAFAYTYHYLNWFSKTSIIGWNKNLSKSKMLTILTIWILSIILYVYNFKVGFLALLFLSLVHVFLEFPLNMTSIKGIVTKGRKS